MLIIGHRGAAGLAPENTLESLQAGLEAGADMLEFDVRLTRDGVVVLFHDFHTYRTHGSATVIGQRTLAELRAAYPISTLEEVCDQLWGKVILNIELKGRGTGQKVMELLMGKYIKHAKDWDNVMLSSFKAGELATTRRMSRQVNLAMLHSLNPFIFIAYERKLRLTAVGFHRLHLSPLSLEIAKQAGLLTYVYTIDRPSAALLMEKRGIDAIVTNYPDRMARIFG